VKAVIFDMDGVLTATVEYHYLSWKRLAEKFDIPFSREDNDQLLGLTRRRSLEVILKGRHFPEKTIRYMLRLKNEYFMDYVSSMSSEDLLPGVRPLLDEICTTQIKIGVASASRNTKPVLKQLGIFNIVDVVVDGNLVNRSKPFPDVFFETASSLEVQPDDCLVIEDSQAGIEASLAAGMCVVGLGPIERVEKAHASFSSLSGVSLGDLREIFQMWRKNENRSG
jgi:beta-phosphoglucomutase